MPKKINARSAPTGTGTPVNCCGPRGPQQYATPEQQKAQQAGQAGDNPLTSVGGASPERTEFERGRRM